MSDAPTTQKAQSNLTAAERFEAKLRTALAKAGNLVTLRQWQLTVAEKRETANFVVDNLRRTRQNAADQSERRTNAKTQISTIEEQIARLQQQLTEAQAERDEAAAFEQQFRDSVLEYESQLVKADRAIEDAEYDASRAKEVVDAAPMTLMERVMARFAS